MRLWRRRTAAERERKAIERAMVLGIRGTIVCDEVTLPPSWVPPSAAFRVPVPEGEGPRCGICAGITSRGHQTWCPLVGDSAT